jgi:hypothetical protein
MRCPTRVFYLLVFFLAIAVSYVFIHQKKYSFATKNWFVVLLFVVSFIEYFPTNFTYQSEQKVAEVYKKAAEIPGETLLAYPFCLYDGMRILGLKEKDQLSQIRYHKKKIYGGHLSRIDENIFTQHEQNIFWSTLCKLQENQLPLSEVSIPEIRKIASQIGIDNILIPTKYKDTQGVVFLNKVFENQIVGKYSYTGGEIWRLK